MPAQQDLIFLNCVCKVCGCIDSEISKCAECQVEQWRQDAVMEIQLFIGL